MQNIFDIKIDTKNMSTEELQKVKKKVSNILAAIDHELSTRKAIEHKHSS